MAERAVIIGAGQAGAQGGLRIALLSDLHVGSPHYGIERLPEVVRTVNAQRAELVLIAGDFVVAHGMVGGTRTPPAAVHRNARCSSGP